MESKLSGKFSVDTDSPRAWKVLLRKGLSADIFKIIGLKQKNCKFVKESEYICIVRVFVILLFPEQKYIPPTYL